MDCVLYIFGELFAHRVVHQWHLYEQSLCSLLDQARKRWHELCCCNQYVSAQDNAPRLFPLPPPAHL